MYTIYNYAYNGLLYLNNIMRPRHKRLSQLMIYSTTLCQSKCKHCNIWQKRPVEELRPRHEKKEFLFQRNNYTPILANNQVYTQGYYSEIEAFISQVEKKESKVTTCLKAVRGTYELLQTVQSAKTSLSEHKNDIHQIVRT